MSPISPLQKETLTGRGQSHLAQYPSSLSSQIYIHHEVYLPFNNLKRLAQEDGLEIEIVSGHRNYDRQKIIWEEKLKNHRPAWDWKGNNKISLEKFNDHDKIWNLLRWTAYPGTSRHHWGTDFDIIDLKAMPENYQVQLTRKEVEDGGIFSPLHEWLDEKIDKNESFGFFRPYNEDRDGVAQEKWHISYAPLSSFYQDLFTLDVFVELVETSPILLSNVVLENCEEIYDQFIDNTSIAPFELNHTSESRPRKKARVRSI